MRVLGRLLLLLVVIGLVGGAVALREPLWLERQFTHLGLFFSHVQSNYVLTPEGRVHYYDAEPRIPGGGVPLVLIHGLGDRDESWAPMLKRLKRAGFHVYAPDLLGYGRSPHTPNGDYSIPGQTKYVYDFIQALGLQKTDLGGWSLGGWIAVSLAHEHPELLDRVVLFDAAGLKSAPPIPPSVFEPNSPADIARLWSMMEPEAKPLPSSVQAAAVRSFGEVRPTVEMTYRALKNGPFLDDLLPNLPEPLLIVWGSTDGLTPLRLGREMHDLVPRSELDIVEGCGHLEPSLCAARVAPAVADFLKSTPPPEGGVRTLANMAR